jgi:hypothetical protein
MAWLSKPGGVAGADPRCLGRRKTENGQKAAEMIVLNAGAALYAADHAIASKKVWNWPTMRCTPVWLGKSSKSWAPLPQYSSGE